jgi:tripartite ATP-independent transporter DctM subunit
MEWWAILLIFVGGFIALTLLGLPVAFAFIVVTMAGAYVFWGGGTGLKQCVLSMQASVTTFTLLPVPMFILMGEVMFQSKVAFKIIDALESWLGALPGRLGLLAILAGALFSTLSGAAMASTALLGTVLTPEVERRGYAKSMSIGPILGSSGLAIMVPPSALGVILATIAEISVGGLLMAIIVPGLIMAVLYSIYIVVRCKLQPSIAPPYEVTHVALSKKLGDTASYVLPIGFIIFLVIGLILLGIASPTESAAAGALGCFILVAAYKKLNWKLVKDTGFGTLKVTAMIFMIFVGSRAFATVLGFSGATQALTQVAVSAPLAPIMIVFFCQILVLILGCFMEQSSMMMITLPIFMPIVAALGFNPIWFGALMCLNVEMACTTPPFGVSLFVMKGVAPADTTMGDIYRAALPFLAIDFIVMVLMMVFPQMVLWLPGLIR